MASRKQQRRRQKERRHEYELVVIDETGEERPIDPAELRAKRREKDAERAKVATGKAAPARGARSSRPVREVKPPSWDRVWKRAGAFAIFMFLVLNFLGKDQPLASRIALPVIYSALFVPFLFLMDRVQYRQYLKRTGQEDPTAKARGERPRKPPSAPSSPRESGRSAGRGLGAGLRRGRRR